MPLRESLPDLMHDSAKQIAPYAYGTCTRARVAIDVPCAADEGNASAESILHLGHARTVLLASLIAEEVGLPLDIRLDGVRCPGRSHEAGVLVSLCTIIAQLNVQCRRVYWIAQQVAAECEYDWALGGQGKAVRDRLHEITGGRADYIALVEDDLLYNHPSLVVRGSEFADCSLAHTETTGTYVSFQRDAYATAGREWYEINVPLVTLAHRKLSKSLGTSLTWDLFTRYPGDWVRDFLIATALSPTEPLGKIGCPFRLEQMTKRAYEWDWQEWDRYIRMKEQT